MPRRLAPITLLLTLSLVADAAPCPTSTSSAAQARAALAQLNRQLLAAQSMQFSCSATIPNQQAMKMGQTRLSVQGHAQRPNKFYIEVKRTGSVVGIIVSDGKTEYAYNPVTRRYAEFTPTQSYQNTEQGLAGGLAQFQSFAVFDTETLPMDFVIEPVAVFLHAQTDIGASELGDLARYKYAVSHTMVNGTPATTIVQRYDLDAELMGNTAVRGGGDWIVSLGKDSGLPLRFVKDMNVAGHSMQMGRYDFHSFRVSNIPLPASAFSWTPPAGAKLFHPSP